MTSWCGSFFFLFPFFSLLDQSFGGLTVQNSSRAKVRQTIHTFMILQALRDKADNGLNRLLILERRAQT